MDFDEIAIAAMESVEWMQRLDHPRALGPATAGSGRKRQYGNFPVGQATVTNVATLATDTVDRGNHVIRFNVFDHSVGR